MTSWDTLEETVVVDLAAADSWAAIEQIYAAGVARIAALAETSGVALPTAFPSALPTAFPVGRPIADPMAGIVGLPDVRSAAGLLSERRARHASAETATLPRLAA